MVKKQTISQMKAAALAEAKKVAHGNTGLARALNGEVTPQAVAQWRHVPVERVLKVEKATGVSRHRLRPDIYPAPDGVA